MLLLLELHRECDYRSPELVRDRCGEKSERGHLPSFGELGTVRELALDAAIALGG